MDSTARKATWDILIEHRVGRTIIISSHDMEVFGKFVTVWDNLSLIIVN